jgi:HEAT repeat protein
MITLLSLLCSLQEESDLAKRVSLLIHQLGDEQVEVREAAESELATLGQGVIPLLEQALTGEQPVEVRGRISNVLDRLAKLQQWVEELVTSEEGYQGRQKLQEAIRSGKFDKSDLGAVYRTALLDDRATPQLRNSLLQGAREFHLGEVWKVIPLLTEKDPVGVEESLSTLHDLPIPPEAVESILRILPKVHDVYKICETLERIRGVDPEQIRETVDVLLEKFEGTSGASTLLSKIADGRMNASLRTLLILWTAHPRDREYHLRSAFLRAIPDESLPQLLKWLSGEDDMEVELAADYAARHQIREAFLPLVEALENLSSHESQLRDKLLRSLQRLHVEEEVKKGLADGKPISQRQALRVVADLEWVGMKQEVLHLLEAEDPEIREQACRTAAVLNLSEAIPRLDRLWSDPAVSVRGAALQALVRMQREKACEFLLRGVLSDEPELQASALEVLHLGKVEPLLNGLLEEKVLPRSSVQYALCLLIVEHGEPLLHRVMARAGGSLSSESMRATIDLIRTARPQLRRY